MAPKVVRVAFFEQKTGLLARFSFGVYGVFIDFLPLFLVPVLFVYLGSDRWFESISEVANQKIFDRGSCGIELFQGACKCSK